MKVREQATDSHGVPLAPDLLVRVPADAGYVEARIVRVIGDYGVATVVVESKAGRAERMVPCAEIEVLAAERAGQRARRSVA